MQHYNSFKCRRFSTLVKKAIGRASGIESIDLSAGGTADAAISGTQISEQLGMYLLCGDINCDGYQDIITRGYQGINNFFYGSASGFVDMDSSAADDVITWAGTLKACGDLNGDGYTDLLTYDDSTIYGLFSGSGGISDVDVRVSGGDIEITGTSCRSVKTGDVNGDGYIDIAVGDTNAGAAYIFEGRASGFPQSFDAADANTTISGISGSAIGSDVLLKDLDGDGYAEFLMGAPNFNSEQGCVYIQRGGAGGISGMDYSTDTPGALITGDGGRFGSSFDK